MQFNSFDFMFFFPIVVLVYYLIPGKLRSIWLLSASYYFYMGWNKKYALLIAFSTVATYLGGIIIDRFDKDTKEIKVAAKNKKLCLYLVIVLNLSVLFIFKYADFLLESADVILKALKPGAGIERRLGLLLPVGISFYTFQALGYIIDVYRKDIPAEKNIIHYALFVSFFPQLVAGPIERSKNLLSQIKNLEFINPGNLDNFCRGAIIMIWGFFQKLVIADRVGILVDNVFDDPIKFGSCALLAGSIGFSIQIYTDFGAYSLIATGAAKILGVNLMDNFNAPYLSQSIHEFWTRWHISLSGWFRDYLYIPLGGSRKGLKRKNANRMIVFLLSGIWHGAGWNYLAWGGLHGLYQMIGDLSSDVRNKFVEKYAINTDRFGHRLFRRITCFALVSIALIIFRADTIAGALSYIGGMFTRFDPWSLADGSLYMIGLDRLEMNILVLGVLLLFIIDYLSLSKKKRIDALLMDQGILFSWFFTISIIVITFVFGKYGADYDPKQFIYFQF